MENATKECQSLFKRLICYHCFRENKYAKATATYLNKTYGKNFITEGAVQKWFKLFKDKDEELNFNDLCQLSYTIKKKRTTKPVPADPPPLDDDMEAAVNGRIDYDHYNDVVTESIDNQRRVQEIKVKAKKSVSNLSKTTSEDNESESENKTTNLGRSEKRKLILRCYKAKYTVGETNRYLNSIHGKGFINKTSVYTWYRRFEQKDFKLGDKNRSGRPQKVNEAKGQEITQYVESNPTVNLRQIAAQFKLSTGTLSRLLPKLGIQYVVDRWIKTDQLRPEVSDDELRKFKDLNPNAKVKDVAEHFMISRIVIAQRLRKLGFDIPKWPKKKRISKILDKSSPNSDAIAENMVIVNQNSVEETDIDQNRISHPSPIDPIPSTTQTVSTPGGETMIITLQTHAIPMQTDSVQAHQIQIQQMQQQQLQQQQSHQQAQLRTQSQSQPHDLAMNQAQSHPQSTNLIQHQQQQQQQQQISTSNVVSNSLLPAVLRRKPNPIQLTQTMNLKNDVPRNLIVQTTPSSTSVTQVMTSTNPQQQQQQQQQVLIAENLSTNDGRHQQHSTIINGYQTHHQHQQQQQQQQQSQMSSSHLTHNLIDHSSVSYGTLQNLIVASGVQLNSGQQQQSQQQSQGDQLHTFDPYNSQQLDTIQSILHPYYQ